MLKYDLRLMPLECQKKYFFLACCQNCMWWDRMGGTK